jgi:hypothetical protein
MKTNEVHVNITILEEILKQAKAKAERKDDTSNTIVLKCIENGKYHNATDNIQVYLESVYAECNNHFVCQNY